jgi:hypothetical protein
MTTRSVNKLRKTTTKTGQNGAFPTGPDATLTVGDQRRTESARIRT